LLALPTDTAGWIDLPVLARRVLALGDEAMARPYDVAVAIARLAPWGRDQALELLRDVPGALAATLRAACGCEDGLDEVPEPVRRTVAWLLATPPTGAPYRYGEPATPAPPRQGLTIMAMMAGARLEEQPDGSIDLNLDNAPAWLAFPRWQTYERHTWYAPAWGLSQWPGHVDWIWDDPLLGRRFLRHLLNPNLAVPSAAVARVVELLGDDEATMRTLAADVLTRAVGDGRLTSAGLAAALAPPWHPTYGGRLATGLARVAASGPLHRAVVAHALVASVPAWTTLPARPLCTVLELLDEAYAAGGNGVPPGSARESIAALAKGRSRTATLAARVLAHDWSQEWPLQASAAAVRGRLERARRR
jgi:hypothetical protein